MEVILIAIIFGVIAAVGLIIYEKVRTKINNRQRIKEVVYKDEKYKDYSTYIMTVKEQIFYSCLAGLVLFTIGYIFYHNIILSALIALFGLLYQKIKTKELITKRKEELNLQFKQSLYSLSSALLAGKSVENAFKEVVDDLRMLYPNPDTYIIREFEIINRRFENGEPIENAIYDFSRRADIEDIYNFADVFITCKRTGGDLIEVIRRTSNIISNKIETQQEISVLISQKKLEAQILSIAPFVIVATISFSSKDYMEPLYQFGIGSIIMTISLIILIFSYLISKWIMNIKV
ncbi:MAG: type II secretion system F family protein [Vulcanibacillus sp.]